LVTIINAWYSTSVDIFLYNSFTLFLAENNSAKDISENTLQVRK